jgi:hypothetical protein
MLPPTPSPENGAYGESSSLVDAVYASALDPAWGAAPTIAGHPYFSPYEDLKAEGR